ncbi:hypothetical protein HD554DRAFT_2037470 [Boletus coccyginus]|nr:hypothetical protein HD554DRAFT_2037470 [Boletus coccyginus]
MSLKSCAGNNGTGLDYEVNGKTGSKLLPLPRIALGVLLYKSSILKMVTTVMSKKLDEAENEMRSDSESLTGNQASEVQSSNTLTWGRISPETKPQDIPQTPSGCVVAPGTPNVDSPTNSSSPTHSTRSVARGPGEALTGTLSAIGALKCNTFASFKQYGTPYRNDGVNFSESSQVHRPTVVVEKPVSDLSLHKDDKREEEEAKLMLEAVHAQHNVCILEKQLVTAKLEEMVALDNLYCFRATKAEQQLDDANAEVGHICHDICKNGVLLHNPRKRCRSSLHESIAYKVVACSNVHSIQNITEILGMMVAARRTHEVKKSSQEKADGIDGETGTGSARDKSK